MNLSVRAHLWLSCIQQGFVAILPVVFLGALALTLAQIPHYFPDLTQHALFKVVHFFERATYGVLAFILVVSISYKLAHAYRLHFDVDLDELMVAMGAAVTLVAIAYMNNDSQEGINFGFAHMIHAIIIGIIFTELMVAWLRFSGIHFSYLEHDISGPLSAAIRMILPTLLISILMLAGYYIVFLDLSILSSLVTLSVGEVNPEQGISVWQTVRLVLLNQVFWFFGIHGSSVIAGAGDLVFLSNNALNFNANMMNHYAYLGGSGCTLGLVMTLFFSKRQSNRKFAKYAVIPSLFNINELVLFGLPIVLNRFLLLPFLLMPLLAIALTQLALSLGLVEFTNQNVNWSMPFLLGGYLLSEDWRGAALQLVVCIISGYVYWPFLKRFDVHQTQQQSAKIKDVIAQLSEPDTDFAQMLRSRHDEGAFCRRIVKDLAQLQDLEMHYQPKVDGNGDVFGAEALLRWHHPVYGPVSPALFIPIAEANGLIHELGFWVIERCFKDMKIMDRSYGFKAIPIAINVSPIQLSRADFLFQLKQRITGYGIEPSRIELEITEGQKLKLTDELLEDLRQLSAMGVTIAVDDFGMGHTSLHYLKSFPVQTIKIDGDIIRDVATSALVKEIVQSMGQLAKGMNAKLVAEWVEQKAQLEVLQELGCHEYQGSYFSMPLPLPELVAYCVTHQKSDGPVKV